MPLLVRLPSPCNIRCSRLPFPPSSSPPCHFSTHLSRAPPSLVTSASSLSLLPWTHAYGSRLPCSQSCLTFRVQRMGGVPRSAEKESEEGSSPEEQIPPPSPPSTPSSTPRYSLLSRELRRLLGRLRAMFREGVRERTRRRITKSGGEISLQPDNVRCGGTVRPSCLPPAPSPPLHSPPISSLSFASPPLPSHSLPSSPRLTSPQFTSPTLTSISRTNALTYLTPDSFKDSPEALPFPHSAALPPPR